MLEEGLHVYNDGQRKIDYVPSRRNHAITVKLTAQEALEIEKAASAAGVPKATYLRMEAIKAARKKG